MKFPERMITSRKLLAVHLFKSKMKTHSGRRLKQLLFALLFLLAIAPALSHGGEIWVANGADGTVSVVDTDTMTEIAVLPSGQYPAYIEFTDDGQFALVSVDGDFQGNGDGIWVYDADTLDVLKTFGGEFNRRDAPLFRNPVSGLIYWTDCDLSNPSPPEQGLLVIDPVALDVIDLNPLTPEVEGIYTTSIPWWTDFTPDGGTAYSSNCTSGNFQIFDLAASVETGSIPLSRFANSVAISPDGSTAMGGSGKYILVADLIAGQESFRFDETDPAFAYTQGVVFTPDGMGYVAGGFGQAHAKFAVYQVDVSDAYNPVIQRFDIASSAVSPWGIRAQGQKLYVLLRKYLSSTRLLVELDTSTGSPVFVRDVLLGTGGFDMALRPEWSPGPPPGVPAPPVAGPPPGTPIPPGAGPPPGAGLP